MKKPNKVVPLWRYKQCNLCGEMTGNYQVIENGIVCYDCVPKIEIHKIPNEKQMREKILEKSKNVQKDLL